MKVNINNKGRTLGVDTFYFNVRDEYSNWVITDINYFHTYFIKIYDILNCELSKLSTSHKHTDHKKIQRSTSDYYRTKFHHYVFIKKNTYKTTKKQTHYWIRSIPRHRKRTLPLMPLCLRTSTLTTNTTTKSPNQSLSFGIKISTSAALIDAD